MMMAVLVNNGSNGPKLSRAIYIRAGCNNNFAGTSQVSSTGIFFKGRKAAVTPIVNRAHGAAALASIDKTLSTGAGLLKLMAAAAMPMMVAMIKGWVKMFLSILPIK